MSKKRNAQRKEPITDIMRRGLNSPPKGIVMSGHTVNTVATYIVRVNQQLVTARHLGEELRRINDEFETAMQAVLDAITPGQIAEATKAMKELIAEEAQIPVAPKVIGATAKDGPEAVLSNDPA